jgi:putative ABC transport system ATP-binding protein
MFRKYDRSDTQMVSMEKNSINQKDSIPALQVENLSKVYNLGSGENFIALNKINFSIQRGEFVSIVGPSGSGKSTLLNLIGALDKPSYGKAFIDGIDVFELNDAEITKIRSEKIGFIFQSYNLINRTTVKKNVELPAILLGVNKEDRVRRAEKLLDFLGIRDKINQKASNLSGGQQQRVAIARALVNNPTIILADEPTGNLDSKTGDEIFQLLQTLCKKFGRTVIMVTHNPELATKTNRSISLKDGVIEKDEVFLK